MKHLTQLKLGQNYLSKQIDVFSTALASILQTWLNGESRLNPKLVQVNKAEYTKNYLKWRKPTIRSKPKMEEPDNNKKLQWRKPAMQKTD